MEAITRKEKIMSGENLTPITRKEMFLAKAAGMGVEPPEPITREEFFLSKIGGTGGGGGTGGEEWIGDGKTHLWIEIAAEGRMKVPLYFQQSVSNGVTIDWGDGSATQTLSVTGFATTTHTYASIGKYIITLDVADGCTLELGYGNSTNCIIGRKTDSDYLYTNMLKRVEIGNAMDTITNYAFQCCHSLSSVNIPNSVTSIGKGAFYSCYSLKSIVIPDSVTSIGEDAFCICYTLASVNIPNSVTSIGASAFAYTYPLPSVNIPVGVAAIPAKVFQSCYSLVNIVIPSSVTSIGTQAFYRCFAMKLYDFTNLTSVPTLESTSAFDSIPSDCRIRVPAALYDEWIAATNWSTYASNIVAV